MYTVKYTTMNEATKAFDTISLQLKIQILTREPNPFNEVVSLN